MHPLFVKNLEIDNNKILRIIKSPLFNSIGSCFIFVNLNNYFQHESSLIKFFNTHNKERKLFFVDT
jgi:hypothetical protein